MPVLEALQASDSMRREGRAARRRVVMDWTTASEMIVAKTSDEPASSAAVSR
jgi:hypothetical protein